MSWLDVKFATMAPEHRQVFNDLGATEMSSLSSVPYIMYTKKGDNRTTVETYGMALSDYINFTTDIVSCAGKGQITTPVIGPST